MKKNTNKYWENEDAFVTATEGAEIHHFKEAGKLQLYSVYYKDDERNLSRACVWNTDMKPEEAVKLAYGVMKGLLDSGVENDAFSDAFSILEQEYLAYDGGEEDEADGEGFSYEGEHLSYIDGELSKVGRSKKWLEQAEYVQEWLEYIFETCEEIQKLKGKAKKEAVAALKQELEDFEAEDEVVDEIMNITDSYIKGQLDMEFEEVMANMAEIIDGLDL